ALEFPTEIAAYFVAIFAAFITGGFAYFGFLRGTQLSHKNALAEDKAKVEGERRMLISALIGEIENNVSTVESMANAVQKVLSERREETDIRLRIEFVYTDIYRWSVPKLGLLEPELVGSVIAYYGALDGVREQDCSSSEAVEQATKNWRQSALGGRTLATALKLAAN
ncbi:MAG: hypothetical protein HOH89_07695, partial [Alphaproteobacteria bacterium]|nr:hypothetical protein [Alphaproteobacteria bacterium]